MTNTRYAREHVRNSRGIVVLLLTALLASLALSIESPRERLQRLRGEIDSLSAVLSEIQTSERNLSQRVSTLDQQIATRVQLIGELEAQIASEKAAVQRYSREVEVAGRRKQAAQVKLGELSGEVTKLEELIHRRAVYVYKHGARAQLRFLMAADSPGDLFRRRLYVNRVQDNDQKNLERLRDARQRQDRAAQNLAQTERDLNRALENKRQSLQRSQELAAETRTEQARLSEDREQIAGMLSEVRQDQASVEQMIADRKQSLEQVEEWIVSLERQRAGGAVQEIRVRTHSAAEVIVRNTPAFESFSQAKGRLPWPLRGRVLTRFGLQTNSITGTVTENPGIDIQADAGDEVLAVQAGVCTRITYLRGFGTTMLVDHGDGYYTVYAHLGDLLVSEGEEVQAGRVIGRVGPESATGSPRLHFQVWKQRQKQDPLDWLGQGV